MKTPTFILSAVLLVGGFSLKGQSQGLGAQKTPLQALQALKIENAKLLERQAVTLTNLDDLQKNAAQMRIFAHKS